MVLVLLRFFFISLFGAPAPASSPDAAAQQQLEATQSLKDALAAAVDEKFVPTTEVLGALAKLYDPDVEIRIVGEDFRLPPLLETLPHVHDTVLRDLQGLRSTRYLNGLTLRKIKTLL